MQIMEKFIISFVLGCFGMGYFVYGKKQNKLVSLVSGIGLFALPYFTSNIYGLIGAGIFLMALPFFLRY